MRLLLLLALAGCRGEPPADLLVEGTIRLDATHTTDALAVRDGVVVAVGEEALRTKGPATRVSTPDGVVNPGFQDAHTHLLPGSFVLDRLLVRSATSMDALASDVRSYGEQHPEEPWIIGYGWNETMLADPDGRPLTAVEPDRPVLLVAASGHTALVNARALALAGVTADTPDPDGGTLVRDPDTGEPTGLLREGALSLVVPAALAAYGDDALTPPLEQRLHDFAHGGLTAISEILAAPGVDLSRPWLYQDLESQGRLPLRVNYYLPLFSVDGWDALEAERVPDTDRVRFAGAKIWVDGAISTEQGWTEEAWRNTGDHGTHYFDEAQLESIVEQSEARGIPLKMHVMGDAAVHAALDAMEAVAAEHGGLTQTDALEHVVLLSDADRARIAALGAVASVQPAMVPLYEFTDWPNQLGIADLAQTYDLQALVDAGATVALGTDWPVWPQASPTMNLWIATTEADLTPEAAYTGYTEGPALAAGRAGVQGCLRVGCDADFVVTDRDLLAVDPSEWSDVDVRSTWIGGRQVP